MQVYYLYSRDIRVLAYVFVKNKFIKKYMKNLFNANHLYPLLTVSLLIVFAMIAYDYQLFPVQLEEKQYDSLQERSASKVITIGELSEGVVVAQEIPYFGEDGISLLFATWGNRSNSGEIRVCVVGNDSGIIYVEKIIQASKIKDNSYVDVFFSSPREIEEKELVVSIESNSELGKAVTLWASDNDTILDHALFINGVKQNGDIEISYVNRSISHEAKTLLFFCIYGIVFAISIRATKKLKSDHTKGVVYFLLLFIIYVMHSPEDLFSAYLWAEDGTVLIQGSIFDGLNSIFIPWNGTIWVIPKTVALVCYRVMLALNHLDYLPHIQGISFKLLATASVFWFTSDKFECVLREKQHRFFICVAIMLFLPANLYDITTCDLPLSFVTNFTVFLLGLYLVCSPETKRISFLQTIFLSLMALSTAAAPFTFAVAALGTLRWFIARQRDKKLLIKEVGIEGVKLSIVAIAVLTQLVCVASSSRASSELALVHRFSLNMKYFVVFTYWERLHTWTALFLGLILWVARTRFVKVPSRFLAY